MAVAKSARIRTIIDVIRQMLLALSLLGAPFVDAPLVRAEEPAYPVGASERVMEGLRTALLVPEELGRGEKHSLVVLLHGNGDSGPNLIHAMAEWAREGYVVCAPSARQASWNAPDLAATLRIAAHLKKVLPIDPRRVHVVGFSNGGWNLETIAFDDELRPCSATWVAAGFRGGSVPKWAKKEMGALALAGSEDANAGAARATVSALAEKARSAEVRIQPDLGHKWPRELMPYFLWWTGAMEGRAQPGVDRNFEWGDSIEEAVAELEQAKQKKGGILVYVWSKSDTEEDAAAIQNDLLMDPLVRHYGNQLKAVKLEMGESATALGIKESPALALLDREGKPKKIFAGKLKAKSLASGLRTLAPDKRPPAGK